MNQTIDELRTLNPNVNDNDIERVKSYLTINDKNRCISPNDVISLFKSDGKFEPIYEEESGFNLSLVDKLDGLSDIQKKSMKGNMNKKIGEVGGRCGNYIKKVVGYLESESLDAEIGEYKSDRIKKCTDTNPKIGGIIFLEGGPGDIPETPYGDYGHVAGIIGISPDGKKVKVRESNMDNEGPDGTISERWIDLDAQKQKGVNVRYYNNTPLANALENRE